MRVGALAIVLAALLGSSSARAADSCFSAEARAALTCEDGERTTLDGKRKVRFAAPNADAAQKPRPVAKHEPSRRVEKASPRDLRRRRHGGRIKQLLMKELSEVSRLLRRTPQGHPDHPKLLRRLGDGYAELAALAGHERLEAEIEAQRAKRLKKAELARSQDAIVEREGKRERTARKLAVRQYRALLDAHPAYCNLADQKDPQERSCADEVLYYLAYEHEQEGKLDEARDAYLELVTSHKQSKFLASAYVAFGELFFQRAQGDPSQWGLARQAYEQALRIAPPKNRLWGYAAYKLGYVHWNQGDPAKALAQFEQTIRFAAAHPDLPGTAGLVDATRRDLVAVYALSGEAQKAFAFLQPLSGDGAGESRRTLAMMEELGRALLDTGHYAQAITLYRDLIARNDGVRACEYRSGITRATMATRGGEKKPVLAVLGEQLDGYQRLAASSAGEEAKRACANATAALLTETAMSWHLEAIGSGDVRGTMAPETLAAAEQLYDLVAKSFTADDFARFTFPRIVKEDWPSYDKVLYARADLLFERKDWLRCGAPFEAAYEAAPRGPNAAEALFAAAVCWRNRLDAATRTAPARSAALAQRELSAEEKGMLRAFDRYACRIAPPAGDDDARALMLEIKMARGRTYFEAGHFEQAALAFREVALEPVPLEATRHAAEMYLTTLEAMRKQGEAPRPGCAEELARDLPRLQELHCRADKDDARAQTCDRFARVARDLGRLQLESLVQRARDLEKQPGAGARALELYRDAGEGYLKLWNDHGRAACQAKAPLCGGYEEVLFNAAAALQAGRLLGRAIKVREQLLEPRYGFSDTSVARRATLQLAGNYQAIASYEQAARYYERFAEVSPAAREAPTALKDAVVLRLGLGQHEQALADARRFRTHYGGKRPEEAAQIGYALAAHHAERGQWREAEQRLDDVMADVERHAGADLQLEAQALLGRALAAQEKRTEADAAYGRVRAAAVDLAALERRVAAAGGDDADKQRRWRKALTAVGEALLHFADRERAEAEALPFPRYRGDRSRRDLERFFAAEVKPWLEKKQRALADAEAAYRAVIELNGGAPPPRWAIAASAATGELWAKFVDDALKAPYPKEWDQDGFVPGVSPPTLWHELRADFQAGIARAVEPHRLRAKVAFEHCLENGVLFQHFDDELGRCEAWLAREFPQEYHSVDELSAPPTALPRPGHERARPLER